MAFLPSFLFSLLFGMTPLIIAAVLLPVLCQGAVLSLPAPFLTTHFFMALFSRIFLDLAAAVWLFLPIILLLALVPAFISVYVNLALMHLLSTALESMASSLSLFKRLSREVHVKKGVYDSVEKVSDSVEEFFSKVNFTEIFQNVNRPPWEVPPMPAFDYADYNISEAIRNLTISEYTRQYIDTVNVAFIGLLERMELSNFFNTTSIPPHLHASFDEVSETIHDLAAHLNFTEMLREATVPPHVQESFGNLGDALGQVGQNFNLTELLGTLSSDENEEALRPLLFLREFIDPAAGPESFGKYVGPESWEAVVRNFFAWVPKRIHIAASAYVFFLLIGIPGIFFLRAALQDGCLWFITRRYTSSVSSEQRSSSGWIFVAGVSGLVSAAAEAFPYCLIYFYLYNSDVLSAELISVLVVHTLTTVPLRASSHLRLAEASVRRDLLKDSTHRFLPGFLLSVFINGLFNIWWLCLVGLLMMSLITFWLPGLFILIDSVVIGFAVFWGRSICQRLLRDERQMIEDRERKRD